MVMRINHSVSTQDRAVSADGIEVFDLSVNPLSAVLVCLRPLNDTGTLSNFQSYMGIVGAINRASILFRGEQVFSMSGRDAAALAYFRHGIVPPQATHVDTNNDRRCVVLPLLLGRFAYDPASVFPASRRGELTLELDLDIADTGYDGLRISIESVELLGVSPKEFERKVTQTMTFPATGDNDVDLPVGNVVRGALCFGTTGFAGASPAPTLGRLSVLLDNQQHSVSSSDFEVAHMMSSLMGRQPPILDAHGHRVDATAASATQLTDGGPINVGGNGFQNYCFLDFDPTRDDLFSIDTKGHSRLTLRSNAEAAEAVRVVSIEQVKL